MNKYEISIKSIGAKLEVSYRNGLFHQLRHKSGKLSQEQHEFLMKLAPQLEKGIMLVPAVYGDKFEITELTTTTNPLSQFLDTYIAWFVHKFAIQPKLSGIDINAMKSIVKYLEQQDSAPLEVWQVVLDSWDKLPDFYKGKPELKNINSNFNIILTNIIKANQNESSKYSR